MSKWLQLMAVAVLGFTGARIYFLQLLKSPVLHAYGVAGSWALLIAPVVAVFLLFVAVGIRPLRSITGLAVTGAAMAALLVVGSGLVGDLFWCIFITQGTCK